MWALARPFGRTLGVSRISPTTALDRVGIPTWASVRADAAPDNLCVNGGKGLTDADARVGALMEAIEFALAEPGRSEAWEGVQPAVGYPAIAASMYGPRALLDLCPLMGTTFRSASVADVVEAERVGGGPGVLLPVELVFCPVAGEGGAYGRGNTNGLASGATVEEATLHAVWELVERDALSLAVATGEPLFVDPLALPEPASTLAARLAGVGELHVRALPAVGGAWCFEAVLVEDELHAPLLTARGMGAHLSPVIGLSRALAEVAQGRTSQVHGGRDDVAARALRLASDPPGALAGGRPWARPAAPIGPEVWSEPSLGSVTEALDETLTRLTAAGFREVWRVVLTRPADPVAVVRLVIPGLECFTLDHRRIGPRLAAASRGVRG